MAVFTLLVLVLENMALTVEFFRMVGGKCASLARMLQGLGDQGISVPPAFSTTMAAFERVVDHNNLRYKIQRELKGLNRRDAKKVARAGKRIRKLFLSARLPPDLEDAIWQEFNARDPKQELFWMIRSSGDDEDGDKNASPGQRISLQYVRGWKNVKRAIIRCMASQYTDHLILYQEIHGTTSSATAVCIQNMIDSATAGVMFSLEPETGHRSFVVIDAAYGQGEGVVSGKLNPDRFVVSKECLRKGRPAIVKREIGSKLKKAVKAPGWYTWLTGHPLWYVHTTMNERNSFCLSDEAVHELAKQALTIEKSYSDEAGKSTPMDMEFAIDPKGKIWVVQARPETVHSSKEAVTTIEMCYLAEDVKSKAEVGASGLGVGTSIATGPVRIIKSVRDIHKMRQGEVLLIHETTPDWLSAMEKSAAMCTVSGGRTCHAAIAGRELPQKPAIVVGCGKDLLRNLKDGDIITVSAVDGTIYKGALPIKKKTFNLADLKPLLTKLKFIMANPDEALVCSQWPNDGVGLLRLEFMAMLIGIHPKAILEFDKQSEAVKREILKRSRGYLNPREFYISKLVEGMAMIAAAFAGKPITIRLSDFKTNEYRDLIGGHAYEPVESDPMIGWRGAGRDIDPAFADAFAMECEAYRRLLDMGFENIILMIPFVRTVKELKGVIDLMASHGLKRGEKGLKIFMMGELPTNALIAAKFLELIDGVSIGSNDLTQGVLMLGRNGGTPSMLESFDEMDEAVLVAIGMILKAAKELGKETGICGQGPSDKPEFAEWLIENGIESIALMPDVFLRTWHDLSRIERFRAKADQN